MRKRSPSPETDPERLDAWRFLAGQYETNRGFGRRTGHLLNFRDGQTQEAMRLLGLTSANAEFEVRDFVQGSNRYNRNPRGIPILEPPLKQSRALSEGHERALRRQRAAEARQRRKPKPMRH